MRWRAGRLPGRGGWLASLGWHTSTLSSVVGRRWLLRQWLPVWHGPRGVTPHIACRLAAGGSDMWVRLYDFQTGQELEVCKGEANAGRQGTPKMLVVGHRMCCLPCVDMGAPTSSWCHCWVPLRVACKHCISICQSMHLEAHSP
jgi:hypothetical protein